MVLALSLADTRFRSGCGNSFGDTVDALHYDLTILALPFAWLGWEAYTHEAEFQELTLLFAWCLLAWATLGPPWVLSWAPNFPFRLAVLAALLLLAVYRAAEALVGFISLMILFLPGPKCSLGTPRINKCSRDIFIYPQIIFYAE